MISFVELALQGSLGQIPTDAPALHPPVPTIILTTITTYCRIFICFRAFAGATSRLLFLLLIELIKLFERKKVGNSRFGMMLDQVPYDQYSTNHLMK